jgi:hypothetical protein
MFFVDLCLFRASARANRAVASIAVSRFQ